MDCVKSVVLSRTAKIDNATNRVVRSARMATISMKEYAKSALKLSRAVLFAGPRIPVSLVSATISMWTVESVSVVKKVPISIQMTQQVPASAKMDTT